MSPEQSTESPAAKEYYLFGITDSSRQSVPIHGDIAHKAMDARRGLSVALSLEEKFNLMLENYREFEQELLEIALRRLVHLDFEWSSVQQDIYTMNRRLMNLLSSCRFYTERLAQTLNATVGAEAAQKIKRRTSEAVDNLFAFRFLEALRDHAQHRGLPIYALSYPMNGDRSRHSVEHTLVATVRTEELRSDRRCPASLRAELASYPEEILVTPLVREYVQELARIHGAVRQVMSAQVSTWEEIWRGTIQDAKARFGTDVKGLAIFSKRGSGGWHREVDLWDEFVNRLHFLTVRSVHLPDIARHYVTGSGEKEPKDFTHATDSEA